MNATINDLYPGATPAGTQVEVISRHETTAVIRVGRHAVKVSTRWLDFPTPQTPRRGLKTMRSVLSE